MEKEPIHRRYHHDDLTFGLLYAFHENFILPLSHDEVVHGKGSLLDKMPGDRWQKFANLRAYFAFMWTMPGKKLLFMGGEFGQEREWNHDNSLDWHLLAIRSRGVQPLVRDLNHLYRDTPALHRLDCDAEGFEWIDVPTTADSVISYLRAAATRTTWPSSCATSRRWCGEATASACRGPAATPSAQHRCRRLWRQRRRQCRRGRCRRRIRCTGGYSREPRLPPLATLILTADRPQ